MIICVTGLAGSGKTTTVQYLLAKYKKLGLVVLHINSDFVATKILSSKYNYQLDSDNDFDYSTEELAVIYAAMNEMIRLALSYNPKVVVITDGMYRKNSQRIKLQAIAEHLGVQFYLLKVEAGVRLAQKRLANRYNSGGHGGWVDPEEYEDVAPLSTVTIRNDRGLESLDEQVSELSASFLSPQSPHRRTPRSHRSSG